MSKPSRRKAPRAIGLPMLAFLGAGIVITTLCVAAVLYLGSEAGTKWALAQLTSRVPGLELDGTSGTLDEGLHVERVAYTDGDRSLTALRVSLRMHLWSLAIGRLRILSLSAGEVTWSDQSAPSSGTAGSPSIPPAPLPVYVNSATIDRLSIDSTDVGNFRLNAVWESQHIQIRLLEAQAGSVHVSVAGEIEARPDLRIDLSGTWRTPGESGAVSARGPLERLQVTHHLRSEAVSIRSEGDVSVWPAVLADLRHDVRLPAERLPSTAQTTAQTTVQTTAQTTAQTTVQTTVQTTISGSAGNWTILIDGTTGSHGFQGPVNVSNTADGGWLASTGRFTLATIRMTDVEIRVPPSLDAFSVQAGFGTRDFTPLGTPAGNPLTGSLSGTLQGSGSTEQFEFVGAVASPDLSWGSVRLRELVLDARFSWPSRTLHWSLGAATAEVSPVSARTVGGSGNIVLEGSYPISVELRASSLEGLPEQRESLELTAQGTLREADWQLTTPLDNWRARVRGLQPGGSDPVAVTIAAGGRSHVAGYDFSNEGPIAISVSNGTVAAAQHCWRSAARVCVQRAMVDTRQMAIEGSFDDVSIDLVNTFLPRHLTDDSGIRGGFEVTREMSATPLPSDWQIAANVVIDPFAVLAGERRIDLPPARFDANGHPESWRLEGQGRATEPRAAEGRTAFPATVPSTVPSTRAPSTVPSTRAPATIPSTEAPATIPSTEASATKMDWSMLVSGSGITPDSALTGHLRASLADPSAATLFDDRLARLEGMLEIDAQLAGSARIPRVNVDAKFSDGGLTWLEPEIELQAINAALKSSGQEWQIKGTARDPGGGEFTFTGEGRGLDETLTFNAHVAATGFSLQAPQWSLTAAPQLSVAGSTNAVDVSGLIEVPRFRAAFNTLPQTVARPSADVSVTGRESVEDTPGMDVTGDVLLRLGDDVRVKLLTLDVGLKGEVRIRVREGAEELYGELTLADGTFTAGGQALRIKEGRLRFSGSPTNPWVDAVAVRDIESPAVKVGLRVRGRASAPTTSLYSEPPMDDARILSFLTFGRDISERGPGADKAALVAAAFRLGAVQAGKRLSGLKDKLSLDELQTAPTEDDVSITAGKRISDDIYVRYRYNAFSAIGAFIVRYHLGERWRLEATNDVSPSMDLLYEF